MSEILASDQDKAVVKYLVPITCIVKHTFYCSYYYTSRLRWTDNLIEELSMRITSISWLVLTVYISRERIQSINAIISIYLSLTSWYSLSSNHTITMMLRWECCHISCVVLTWLEIRYWIVGVGGSGTDNHLTSVVVHHNHYIGETTEYTSSCWRIPQYSTEWWSEPHIDNLTNTCINSIILLVYGISPAQLTRENSQGSIVAGHWTRCRKYNTLYSSAIVHGCCWYSEGGLYCAWILQQLLVYSVVSPI